MSLFAPKNKSAQPELVRAISYPHRQHGRTGRVRGGKSLVPPVRLLALVLVVPLLAFAGWQLITRGSGSDIAADNVAAMPEPEPVKSLDYTAMDATIQNVIAANPAMDIGIATVDIKTGDTKTYGVENAFVAASTAKLLTAVAYLHDVEQGKHTLDENIGGRTAEAALEALIVDSDNQAWADLNNVTMGHEELAAYAQTIGFTNYDVDKNTVTATSLATLLSNFYQKRLLNDDHTDLLLSYMERAKEVEYISSTAPAGTKVYHKPGYLSDRMHDAAILDNGERPYVLVIFTKARFGDYNSTAGAAVFTQVATATYDTFLASNTQDLSETD